MMLMLLLREKALDPERGDAVIFNNTSAEHSATYEFVKQCKRETERAGIPFFIVEARTYEDARRGNWQRLQTYQMAAEEPLSDEHPNGYHHKGELFEEMISHKLFVPSQFTRTCTYTLKIQVTKLFLKDWFKGKKRYTCTRTWPTR